MSDEQIFGSIRIQTGIDTDRSTVRIVDGQKARIGMIGNFRGATSDGGDGLQNELFEIDIDNFDDVFRKLDVAWTGKLPNFADPISISFDSLDDFHPDSLFKSLEIFGNLRDLRKRLNNDDEFAGAAAIVEGWDTDNTTSKENPDTREEPRHPDWPIEGVSLLDQILDDPNPAKVEKKTSPVDNIIKEIVAPHVKPASDVRKPDLLHRVDEEIQNVMRQIIQHPTFQQLESRWRAVEMMIRKLEADTNMTIFLLNVTQEQVDIDLRKSDDLSESNLFQLLVGETIGVPGAVPWTLLISDFVFENSQSDISVLGRLAKVGAAAGAPWFVSVADTAAGFTANDSGCPIQDEQAEFCSGSWDLLTMLAESKFVATFWPRFMIRSPYGPKSKPVDSFDFEECDSPPNHRQFPWASGSLLGGFFACRSICEGIAPSALRQRMVHDRLPLFVYGPKKDQKIQHASECLLNDKTARTISQHGINLLRPVRDTNTVFLDGIRSLHGDWLVTR